MDLSAIRDHLRQKGPLKAESFRHVAFERDGLVVQAAPIEVRGTASIAIMIRIGDVSAIAPRQALQLGSELVHSLVIVADAYVLRAIAAAASLTPEFFDAIVASMVAEAQAVHKWIAARRPVVPAAPQQAALAEIWAA
jgi:hypothetical protein